MARPTRCFAVALLLASGCYASHRPASEGGEHCVAPEPSEGNPCGDSSFPRRVPSGVCALDDGSLIAFGELEHAATCGTADGRHFTFDPHDCVAERPMRREVARCGSAASEVWFISGGRPAWGPERFDLSRASCAIADRRVPPPAEPWRPFAEAEELCSDPYAWCGSPIVLELRQPDGDPCGGSTYTERCDASIEEGRIVLRAETASSTDSACLTVIADRVATCVVPPLAAGRWEVVDGEGRALGAIDVPGVQPVGDDLEPRCARIPD
jgi:hypothetical protein